MTAPVVVHQRNGKKLERAYRIPAAWVRDWVIAHLAEPYVVNLPDTSDTCTLEVLWHLGMPFTVVTKGAENLESHPMVDILEEGTGNV